MSDNIIKRSSQKVSTPKGNPRLEMLIKSIHIHTINLPIVPSSRKYQVIVFEGVADEKE